MNQPTESERQETLRAARARLAWGCAPEQVAQDLQLAAAEVAALAEQADA